MTDELILSEDVEHIAAARKVSEFLEAGSISGSSFIIAEDIMERDGVLMKVDKNVFERTPLTIDFVVKKK